MNSFQKPQERSMVFGNFNIYSKHFWFYVLLSGVNFDFHVVTNIQDLLVIKLLFKISNVTKPDLLHRFT